MGNISKSIKFWSVPLIIVSVFSVNNAPNNSLSTFRQNSFWSILFSSAESENLIELAKNIPVHFENEKKIHQQQVGL